jgi:DNA-nicking Smr family endonuclease
MKSIKTQIKQLKKELLATKEPKVAQKPTKKEIIKKNDLSVETIDFKNAIGQVKPMMHDTIHAPIKSSKSKTTLSNINDKESLIKSAEFHFSDEYEPLLPLKGAMKYVREGVSTFESKALRRGDYVPELILDLHGLNQQQAKRELAALLATSKKQHINCVCVVHGIGSRVLKNKIPHYLVQHPDVMAFHQATLEWGGDGALLVLLKVEER